VAKEGDNEVLQLEEEMREVRRGPKGANRWGAAKLTEGEEEAAVVARNMVRGGDGSATGANERSREGEGRLWCASEGEWGEGRGVQKRRAVPFKWHGGRKGKEGREASGVNARMEEGEGRRGAGVAVGWPPPTHGGRA
jgi:hypothetical protein